MLTLLADPLLSVVDTAFVGRLGTHALAALGACTSIFHLAFNTFRATTLATTSLVGPYFATLKKDNDDSNPNDATWDAPSSSSSPNDDKNNNADLRTVTRLSLQFGTLLGGAVAACLLLLTRPILHVMGVPHHSPLYQPATGYLQTRAWAAPCVALTAVATGLFRGAGTTLVPLRASLLASGVNLVLDPVLMFGPIVAWGVKGAAAATAVSQLAATVVLVRALQRRGLWPFGQGSSKTTTTKISKPQRRRVYTTIAKANLSMMAKQGSLLGAWAYCTYLLASCGRL